MRILLSTWSLQVGGGEIFPMSLAAELTRRGHQVWLFNQRAELRDEALVARLLPPAVRVVSMADYPVRRFVGNKANGLLTRLRGQSQFYERIQQRQIAALIHKAGIELVNTHATYADRMCCEAMQQFRVRVPHVITEQGEYRRFVQENRPDFKPVLQAADWLVCVSEFNRHLLLDSVAGLPSSSCIYNASVRNSQLADREAMRRELGIGPRDVVFGMVARGIASKGWAVAAAAFAQVRASSPRSDLHLVLVGDGECFPALRREFGKQPGLHFTGQSPNPAYYMSGFDVGLLPTYFASEALPVVITEYLCHGLPVIATALGGIPEVLGHEPNACGQLLPLQPATGQPDPAELAAAMRHYLEVPAYYQRHAVAATQANRRFSLDVSASQYETLFAQLIASSRGA